MLYPNLLSNSAIYISSNSKNWWCQYNSFLWNPHVRICLRDLGTTMHEERFINSIIIFIKSKKNNAINEEI